MGKEQKHLMRTRHYYCCWGKYIQAASITSLLWDFTLSHGCYHRAIELSFQTDIYQCKIITHGSYPRVKLERPEGRNKKGCRCKERAVESSHPSRMFLGYPTVPARLGSLSLPLFQNFVKTGPKSNLWGCTTWSSRKASLNHAGKQEAHGSFWSF